MSQKIKVNLEAKKNRLRRRLIGALNESLGALALLAMAVAASAVLIYLYNALLSAPGLELKEISVRGVKELTEKDILELAKIQPRCNLLAVNTDAVARRITANPWVRKIYVGRELPGRRRFRSPWSSREPQSVPDVKQAVPWRQGVPQAVP